MTADRDMAAYEDLTDAVRSGGMSVDQARASMGLPPAAAGHLTATNTPAPASPGGSGDSVPAADVSPNPPRNPTAADGAPRVVLVLEYALDPDADPDAVERAVRDYVRRLQNVPLFAPMNPPLIHAAIRDDARRVLAVFGR